MYSSHFFHWVRGVIFIILLLRQTTRLEAAAPPDVFYVSPSGVNSSLRSGSASNPWRTIGYAIGRSEVGSGDIIIVQSDGIDGNDDYTENVIVNKSVKIRADASAVSRPVVKAASTSDSVFEVTVDYVEISGLSIYGACDVGLLHGEGIVSAIELCGVYGCLAERNICGLSAEKYNCQGLRIVGGGRNVIRGNEILYNSNGGIALLGASGNLIHGNEMRYGKGGIGLLSSSGNVIVGNGISDNVSTAGDGAGLVLYSGTTGNVITGNTIERSDRGAFLYDMSGSIIAVNYFAENGVGLELTASGGVCDIFHNYFNSNTVNVASGRADYALGSQSPLFYQYGGGFFKSLLGNRYSDYSGTDGNGDGLGDSPYTGPGFHDEQPLAADFFDYSIYGWTLGATVEGGKVLHDGGWSRDGEIATLAAGRSFVYITEHDFDGAVTFAGGAAESATTWNGWLTFAWPPEDSDSVKVELGSAAGEFTAFNAVGPSTVMSGDGTSNILLFAAPPGPLVLHSTDRLAVRITNTGAHTLHLMTGGGAGAFFAPAGSRRGGPCLPLILLLE